MPDRIRRNRLPVIADDNDAWAHENGSQWGEPYLGLADAEDIVAA